MSDTATTDREIVISRAVNAPPELVFQAFTEQRHLDRWWGPEGFTITTHEISVRTGGTWRFTMHGPDGTNYPDRIRYREVSRERIVFDHDDDGLGEIKPFESVVTFAPDRAGTLVTLRTILSSAEERENMIAFGAVEGGASTLACLDVHVREMQGRSRRIVITYPSDTELVMVREFATPRELVFEVMTKPEHVRRWYGFAQDTMTVCEADVRPGGKWRYAMRTEDGFEFAFSGEYREVEPPVRLVNTECYEPMPGHCTVVTSTFEERDGITTVSSHIQCESKEDREAYVASGMESGANVSYDRAEDLMAELLR